MKIQRKDGTIIKDVISIIPVNETTISYMIKVKDGFKVDDTQMIPLVLVMGITEDKEGEF